MAKLMRFLMLLAVVGFVAVPASADILNTTFEPNSPNTGDWVIPTWTIPWDGPDPASGINWGCTAGYSASVGYSFGGGDQSGRGQGVDHNAWIVLGNEGSRTGNYEMTWQQRARENGSSDDNFYTTLRDGSTDFATVEMQVTTGSGTTITGVKFVAVHGGGTTDLLTGLVKDTWYELKMTVDMGTGKFSAYVKDGGGVWQGSADMDFIDTTGVSSLDKVLCGSDAWGPYSYWDNIKIVPEPATMTLLLLGLPLALRRRRRA